MPKELNSTRLDQFREISLLDVEGKIFWSVVAKRLKTFLLASKLTDRSVQMGGVLGHSGCLEKKSAHPQSQEEKQHALHCLVGSWKG